MNDTLCPTRRPRARIVTPAHGPSRWSGSYWLPAAIGRFLDGEIGQRESAARILARFLCRFHGAPGTLGRSFHILRECKALQERTGLTAKQLRGAIERLTRIGFIARIDPEKAYRWSKAWGKGIRFAVEFRFTGIITKFLRLMIDRKRQGPVRSIATLGGGSNSRIQERAPNPQSEADRTSLHLTGPWSRPDPTPDAKAKIDAALAEPLSPLDRALAALGRAVGFGR